MDEKMREEIFQYLRNSVEVKVNAEKWGDGTVRVEVLLYVEGQLISKDVDHTRGD